MMVAMAVISEIEFEELGMRLAVPPQMEKLPGKEKCPGLCHLLWRMSLGLCKYLVESPNSCRPWPLAFVLVQEILPCISFWHYDSSKHPKDDKLLGFFKINSKDTMMKWRTIHVEKLARLLQIRFGSQ
jgi:hypothetical protein